MTDEPTESWLSRAFGVCLMAFIGACCLAGAVGMVLWIVKQFVNFCIHCK